MAGNSEGKSGAPRQHRQLTLATEPEFSRGNSRSGTGKSNNQDFAHAPSLTSTEHAVYEELISTARVLAKRNIPGTYAHVAEVMELVSEVKAAGGNAIPELAQGLDGLHAMAAAYSKQRRDTIRQLVRDHPVWVVLSAVFLLPAIYNLLLASFYGLPFAAWLAPTLQWIGLSVVCLFPVIWHWTNR